MLSEIGKGKAKILVTSRRDKHIQRHLEDWTTIETRPEDLDDDIAAYAKGKIARNPRLSNPLVRLDILNHLTRRHEGMFLWVYLMLKELKACVSVEDVQLTLGQLPSGLEAVYRTIAQRLQRTLSRRAMEITKKILTWILGCARPLSMDELREALSFQYQLEGHTLLSTGLSSSEFPYAEKEIELMCGSLITIRDGQIQPIHQTTKEYLIDIGRYRTGDPLEKILPDSEEISLQLSSVCLNYLSNVNITPLRELQEPLRESTTKQEVIENLRAKNRLLEYSCLFWTNHVLDCSINYKVDALSLVIKHFDGPLTIPWVVLFCLTIEACGVSSLALKSCKNTSRTKIMAESPIYPERCPNGAQVCCDA